MTAALFPDVVVNGQTVPRALIAAEAQHHAAPRGKPGLAWRKAAGALAVRSLLVQEARRRGLAPIPAELAPGRHETEDEALVRGLLETVIDVAPPTPQAVRAEWARDPGRFRAPSCWEVSHILCACDPGDAGASAAARARARDLCDRALAGPGTFADIARAHSDCASRGAGGALGQLGPGDSAPEFEATLRSLPAGQIAPDPVQTRHGWHVIRMEARADGAVLPFDAVRDRIAEAMERAAWAQAARAFVAGLVATAEISGVDLRAGDGQPGARTC